LKTVWDGQIFQKFFQKRIKFTETCSKEELLGGAMSFRARNKKKGISLEKEKREREIYEAWF